MKINGNGSESNPSLRTDYNHHAFNVLHKQVNKLNECPVLSEPSQLSGSGIEKNRQKQIDFNTLGSEAKIRLIAEKFEDIMKILGLDMNDDSLRDTPTRVAKMYVNEIFKGLDPENKPEITVFKNNYHYDHPLMELDIPFISFCEHHFVPIRGLANIAYIPDTYVIGLSKFHRLVDYYARRPQAQERLTQQIFHALSEVLQSEDIGVVLKASHSCISCRGVTNQGSSTVTSAYSGRIKKNKSIIDLLLGNGGR